MVGENPMEAGLFTDTEWRLFAEAMYWRMKMLCDKGVLQAEMSEGTAFFADGSALHITVLVVPKDDVGTPFYQDIQKAITATGIEHAKKGGHPGWLDVAR